MLHKNYNLLYYNIFSYRSFDGVEYFLKHKVTTVNMYDVDVIKTVYDVNKANFLFFFQTKFCLTRIYM